MDPLSFSVLMVVASLCMPPKRIEEFPYVHIRDEVVLSYPPVAGIGFASGPTIVGVMLEYQFGFGPVQKAAVSGNQSEVEKKVSQILEPHVCVAVG
jgi:hypothetical protein